MAGIEVATGEYCKDKTPQGSPSNSSDLLWCHTARMTSLLIEGLNTDGAHHKQYFLEEVLRVMVPDEFKDCKASWQWENGIAP